jgi:hypothetical protein
MLRHLHDFGGRVLFLVLVEAGTSSSSQVSRIMPSGTSSLRRAVRCDCTIRAGKDRRHLTAAAKGASMSVTKFAIGNFDEQE